MQTSQFHICKDCGSLEEMMKRIDCSLLGLVKNKWANQSYATTLYFDRERYDRLMRYKRIIQRRLMNSAYVRGCVSNGSLTSLITKLLYRSDSCRDCPCEDFTDFISTSSTSSTSSTTTNTSSSTTTIFFTSSTTTTLPDPQNAPVACANQVTYAGGFTFPYAQEIIVGSGLGNVTLHYNAFNIPDKFIVKIDGVEIANTGYVGADSYQADLDENLTIRGMPTEAIVGPGSGSLTFSKNSATASIFVYVFAPLPGTGWTFTIDCPTSTTTTTLP